MNLVWAGLIVVATTAMAVTAMLIVRRGAPEGSYFEDGDRAAGVFGVLATGLSILIGFIIFLSFESYDTSRSGAEAEARLVSEQFATAQLLPPPVRRRLSGELVCYARSVVHQEWPQLGSGGGPEFSPWGLAMFTSIGVAEPQTPSEQAAYAKWLDQTSDRFDARADRRHGAEGVIPLPLWIVLLLASVVVLLFMLLFADSAERMFVQASMMAAVAIVIVSLLLVLRFLDDPFARGVGSLKPVAMERTAHVLETEAAAFAQGFSIPCDARGVARNG